MNRHRLATLIIAGIMLLAFQAGQAEDGSDRTARREQIKHCRALLKEAVKQIDVAQYDSALVALNDALECDADNPDVYYYSGRVYLKLADTLAAVSAITTGVEKAPLSSRLKILLARLQLADSPSEQVLPLLESVLRINPRHGEALYLKGLVFLAEGDTAQAVDIWEKALAISVGREKR